MQEEELIKAMQEVFDAPMPDSFMVSFWPYTTMQQVDNPRRVQIWLAAVRRAEAQLALDWKYHG